MKKCPNETNELRQKSQRRERQRRYRNEKPVNSKAKSKSGNKRRSTTREKQIQPRGMRLSQRIFSVAKARQSVISSLQVLMDKMPV